MRQPLLHIKFERFAETIKAQSSIMRMRYIGRNLLSVVSLIYVGNVADYHKSVGVDCLDYASHAGYLKTVDNKIYNSLVLA